MPTPLWMLTLRGEWCRSGSARAATFWPPTRTIRIGAKTYHSYFVVSGQDFPQGYLAVLVEYLRNRRPLAKFVYHDKFSTSSYFLPSFFFRNQRIFATRESSGELIAIQSVQPGRSSDLVMQVADGQAQLTAVWDGTKARFDPGGDLAQVGKRVRSLQLPTPLPNELRSARSTRRRRTASTTPFGT